MKICVDYDKCSGLGVCESIVPDYFEVNDAGDLDVLKDDVSPEDVPSLQEAVDGCPTGALSLKD